MVRPLRVKNPIWLACIIGVGFLLAGCNYLADYLSFYPSALSASGIVLEADSKYRRHIKSGSRKWTLLVQFETADQKKVQATLRDLQKNSSAYLANDQVSIYYDPKNPQDVRIESPKGILAHSAILLILGGYALFVAWKFRDESWEDPKTKNG